MSLIAAYSYIISSSVKPNLMLPTIKDKDKVYSKVLGVLGFIK